MLVITRKPGESVVIRFGDREVTVVVGAQRGNRSALLFDAPQEIEILRKEVAECRTTKTTLR